MIQSAVETAPSVEPVTVDELKEHLRITSQREDVYLSSLITAARMSAEEFCGKRFINTTMEGYLPAVPTGYSFILSPGPVSSITEIQYYDSADSGTAWSSDYYSLNTFGNVARVQLNSGYSWPAATRSWNPIYVKWVAGYGSAPGDVPKAIKEAVQLMASALWDKRTPSEDSDAQKMSDEAMHILYPYRSLHFGFEE